jgi:hypothetical protein
VELKVKTKPLYRLLPPTERQSPVRATASPPMRGGNGGRLRVGTKPGRGMYLCNQCEQCITLDYDTEKLFECPNCSGAEYRKFTEG